MTLDEVLGRVTIPEDKAFLDKMIKDQNSYITKLETQLKSLQQGQPESKGQPTSIDKVTHAYLERKMKEDTIAQAAVTIQGSIDKAIFDAVNPDWLAFLEKNMSINQTTVDFAVDAFHLVLGRCLAKKDHPVNLVGKGTTPNPTPTPNIPQAGTNAQAVQGVNDIINQTPPVMTPRDANAQSGIPSPQPTQVKNTKDAFANLRARLGGGKNPFQ